MVLGSFISLKLKVGVFFFLFDYLFFFRRKEGTVTDIFPKYFLLNIEIKVDGLVVFKLFGKKLSIKF